MFFTDEAFARLTGTFFLTVFFVHHLVGLQRQCRSNAMRANVHINIPPRKILKSLFVH